jgi:molybdenum cofactor guanylyltransferase
MMYHRAKTLDIVTKNSRSNSANLIGVVLCGGESRRMGRDKGLLPVDGSIWARMVGSKLETMNVPVVYSINQRQAENYSAHINTNLLIKDLSFFRGPLKGLLTVHAKFPNQDFLLVACDMLDMQHATLALLVDAYCNGAADYYAFCSEEFFEPFCAIYTAPGLVKVSALMAPCACEELSLQLLLRKGRTRKLQAVSKESFNNYNTPSHSSVPLRQV